ncbi:rod shape-determining protein MreD [Celeribacter persicus]|uniref:Rod shape-determining protein MreD n=1 Tax=Celeribacter persicus TaxID=1651082 RepID=A0A2T5H5Y4_9RHOB|nr:rod shape-determining protein MreD [Celeribacter persicus]PTQ66993.1 rod shape-determining protein MreD [Celeribacter persicus]
MVDPRTVRTLSFRVGYLLIAFTAAFFYLLPIQVGAGHWPGPDLILSVAFAWVLRRPDYVPVFLFAPVMLIADFIFLRPPGLWTLLSVLGLEFLRGRETTSRDMSFAMEWMMVGGVMLAMGLLYRLVLAVFMVDQTSLGLALMAQLSTLLSYPLVVLVSRYLLGMTKISPSEADEMRYAR